MKIPAVPFWCVMLLLDRFLEQGEDDGTDDGTDEDAHEVHERVADGRDDEDAAVRGTQGAVKEHGERARECRAHDHGGDDAHGVGCRERDPTPVMKESPMT